MTVSKLKKLFQAAANAREGCKFDRITEHLATRPDVHAFVLMDRLCPSRGGIDIVYNTTDEDIILDIKLTDLAKTISPEQVLELVRCGLFFDADGHMTSMY